MRARKKLKKRREPVNYEGHKFTDYLAFIKDNPFIPTTKMDSREIGRASCRERV